MQDPLQHSTRELVSQQLTAPTHRSPHLLHRVTRQHTKHHRHTCTGAAAAHANTAAVMTHGAQQLDAAAAAGTIHLVGQVQGGVVCEGCDTASCVGSQVGQQRCARCCCCSPVSVLAFKQPLVAALTTAS